MQEAIARRLSGPGLLTGSTNVFSAGRSPANVQSVCRRRIERRGRKSDRKLWKRRREGEKMAAAI